MTISSYHPRKCRAHAPITGDRPGALSLAGHPTRPEKTAQAPSGRTAYSARQDGRLPPRATRDLREGCLISPESPRCNDSGGLRLLGTPDRCWNMPTTTLRQLDERFVAYRNDLNAAHGVALTAALACS